MDRIKVSDNIFTEEEQSNILDYCLNCPYTFGEQDNPETPPTGIIHNVEEGSAFYKLFADKILANVPQMEKMGLYRMYINYFAPSEHAYFHTDGEGITFLYYPQNGWTLDDGGETQFYVNGTLYGITPEPNRMVMFDARLQHRATPFRDRHRFTVAIKYQ